jgi:hypothetical protein
MAAFAAGFAFAGALAPKAAAQDWEFAVSPYFWAAGIEGEIGAFPNLPPATIDASFSDILDTLNFAFSTGAEARYDRLLFLMDFSYVDTSATAAIANPNVRRVDIDSDTLTSALAAGWRLVDADSVALDAYAGARLTWSDTTLDLTRTDGAHLIAGNDKTFVDGIIGARGIIYLGDRWALTGFADIGGLSSEFAWQAIGLVDFRFNDWASVSVGWRDYSVDYEDEDDNFVYDIREYGPIIGGTFRF